MNELDQLRAEAEQLKNAIRVRLSGHNQGPDFLEKKFSRSLRLCSHERNWDQKKVSNVAKIQFLIGKRQVSNGFLLYNCKFYHLRIEILQNYSAFLKEKFEGTREFIFQTIRAQVILVSHLHFFLGSLEAKKEDTNSVECF